MNHLPTYVRTCSLHKVRESCHFLDHPPTPMSLRNIKMTPRAKTIYCRVQSFRFKYLTRSLIKQCLVCTRLAVFSFHGKAPKPTLMCFHQFLSGFNYHLLFFKSSTYKCYRPSFYNSIAAFVPVGMLL